MLRLIMLLLAGYGAQATISPGLASEAFIPQLAMGKAQSAIASARLATAALLSTPIPVKRLADIQPRQGAQGSENYSFVAQTGAFNSASITQQGHANSSVVTQQGQSNIARVVQTR
ncbi:hypothetical protein [Bosea sp. 124]|uniref:hypothetical protein n=1 Tax=Bosea sp. 124 TaxID=2135642 RepID=UPI000D46C5A9|nr:hypothetical protein [Bosea sp. 124]PTM41482.1 hypothetical protein C8D03_3026 [Bosea sp. 124]